VVLFKPVLIKLLTMILIETSVVDLEVVVVVVEEYFEALFI
jgi:hypothetical protein